MKCPEQEPLRSAWMAGWSRASAQDFLSQACVKRAAGDVAGTSAMAKMARAYNRLAWKYTVKMRTGRWP